MAETDHAVTAERREFELARDRDFLRKVADATPALLVVVDEDSTVAGNSVNKSFERTIGWMEQEMLGRSFLDLFRPGERERARLGVAAAFAGDEATERLSLWRTRDGSERAISWTATPIIDLTGRELVLVCGVDVTDRQRQEDELRASRTRIVEAAEDARRVLERNLHDGAQQSLVTLSLTLRQAQTRLESDPTEAGRILEDSRAELAHALELLRELARGIHPAVLSDRVWRRRSRRSSRGRPFRSRFACLPAVCPMPWRRPRTTSSPRR
jgi:PAS domain S-box-containing protein